jgi:oligopeptide transport system substrate-binding protein
MRLRPAAILLLLVTCVSACVPAKSAGSETLSADQVLTIGVHNDPGTLDPVTPDCYPDGIDRNIFDGLYAFDDSLNLVPVLAESLPAISNDGRVYTFRLRRGVHFSNGDPLTADDVAYSWARVARALVKDIEPPASYFPVVGYDDFVSGRTTSLRGVTVRDSTTLTVALSAAAGHWLRLLAAPRFAIVDKRVVEAKGPTDWFTTPDGLVGTGPFRMTARSASSMDFEPVPKWWGGDTGALRRVHVTVVGDDLVAEFKRGRIDFAGGGMNCWPQAMDTIRLAMRDPGIHRGELNSMPPVGTWFVRFGAGSGPLEGPAGRNGRFALSLAIDRTRIVRKTYPFAVAATGGPLARGVSGYPGDGSDPGARFDPAAARAIYHRWDPDGSKVKGLTYTYNANGIQDEIAAELEAQWRENLGIHVAMHPVERATFFHNTPANAFPLSRLGWAADYDSPENWFNNTFLNLVPPWEPSVLELAKKADTQPFGASLTTYAEVGRRFVEDAPVISLMYLPSAYLVHSYVRGAGGNGVVEKPWRQIRMLTR